VELVQVRVMFVLRLYQLRIKAASGRI